MSVIPFRHTKSPLPIHSVSAQNPPHAGPPEAGLVPAPIHGVTTSPLRPGGHPGLTGGPSPGTPHRSLAENDSPGGAFGEAPGTGKSDPEVALDITLLDDERLVVLVQEWGNRPARDELIHRYLGLARRLVGHYASGGGLQDADSQDAKQSAVLWILEAIRRYRMAEPIRPGGCHFRGFVRRILASRLVDLCRYLRRRNHGRGYRVVEAHDPGLPECAEEGEVLVRLRQEVARLGEADRALWDRLAAGTPLRQVAAAIGISYDAAKRRRRKLLTRLKSSLSGGQI
jgi:RNA polymerase sigma factor (sigma-70 family)